MNAVEITKKLVQIDSTNPGTNEGAMEDFLIDLVSSWKFDFVNIYKEEAMPGRNNVLFEIPGQTLDPEMVFLCHMDTVPVGKGWIKDPFGARQEDGKIYGRGACDMKSGFACALSAFYHAALEYQKGNLPKRTLKLIGTVDEEGQMHGSAKAIASLWVNEKSMLLDTEPTNVQIQNAHKGRTWFEISVEGITAHASTPWKGADAIAAMAEVISYLRRAFNNLDEHPLLGKSTITFGRIEGGQEPYIVSEDCKVSVDLRLAPPYTTDFAVQLVKEAKDYAEREIKGARVSYKVTGDRPFIDANADSTLLEVLKKSYKQVMGQDVEVGIFNGYTDTAVIAGQLGNKDCMSFGPGSLELAHKPDEYVPVDQIVDCERVLIEFVKNICYND